MTEDVSVKIENADQIADDLAAFPSDLMGARLYPALQTGGEVLMSAVLARTPSDPDATSAQEYGDLKSAIEVKVDLYENGGMAKVGFGEKSYISNWVEYGHWQMSHGASKEAKRVLGIVAAHPFLRPATATAGDEVFEAFAESLMEGFERE
jgi:hypothetical protein